MSRLCPNSNSNHLQLMLKLCLKQDQNISESWQTHDRIMTISCLKHACMDASTHGCIHECIHACIHTCIPAWICACIHAPLRTILKNRPGHLFVISIFISFVIFNVIFYSPFHFLFCFCCQILFYLRWFIFCDIQDILFATCITCFRFWCSLGRRDGWESLPPAFSVY